MQQQLIPIFHLIERQNDNIKLMLDHVNIFMMEQEIYPGGRTCFELLQHIALIGEADLMCLNGEPLVSMEEYYTYWAKELTTTEMISARLDLSYSILIDYYKELEIEDLDSKRTSYWGMTQTNVEWLLSILTHIAHHASQLHSFLKHEGVTVKGLLF